MRLKIRTCNGAENKNFPDNITFKAFLDELKASKLNLNNAKVILIEQNQFRPIKINLNFDTNTNLFDKGIKDNNVLFVTFDKQGFSEQTDLNHVLHDGKESGITLTDQDKENQFDQFYSSKKKLDSYYYIQKLQKYLILRHIDENNSCLFDAVLYALNSGGLLKNTNIVLSLDLRKQVIVPTLKSQPDVYNDAVLGRLSSDYITWILKKDSWGGAIELGILASYFNIRINCINLELGNFIVFENVSDDHVPNKFIILVYNGVHYDVIVTNSLLQDATLSIDTDLGIWDINSQYESLILDASQSLWKILKITSYTTNTNTFKLKCLQCNEILIGNTGANEHANKTGHLKFDEIKS